MVVEWNLRFPLDAWWRKKHKVPFGSERHLQVSQLDIAFEFMEDQLFNTEQKEEDQYAYEPGMRNWLKPRERFEEMKSSDLTGVNDLNDIRFDDNGNILLKK